MEEKRIHLCRRKRRVILLEGNSEIRRADVNGVERDLQQFGRDQNTVPRIVVLLEAIILRFYLLPVVYRVVLF